MTKEESQQHHDDTTATHDSHSQSTHHTSHDALPPIGHTKQQRIYLQLYENLKPILPGHHHHHHHHHSNVQYKAPQHLTTPLALYAIKKLSILDHHLPQHDLRVINPVQPGVLSWMVVFGGYSATALWGMYVWRTAGWKGLWGKKGLIMLGLWAGSQVAIRLADEVREVTGGWRRNRLAKKYRQKYGDQYLLKVLDPAFRLQAHHH